MLAFAADAMAQFRVPEDIGTNPRSLLLVLPLLAAIAVVYKATKVPKVTVGNFLKETILLFGSIIVFMVVTAMVLAAVAWLIIG
ncbi:MAG: hypothetical protein ABSB25_02375 [Sedimentisphaerales bacterium]|jgi:hypothetical protein